ncbi:hydrolase [Mycolicibacterium canariasense]|uniref:Hydrolase n=1 Tax=Mycolicibacterium canariasense TaxID=228230 RepID=A0A100WET2_MYCCR|nr:alpha/beta fold hydrolase [Mycolicibacterium canariasense]MCV7210019.1 alpha/beta fold hydrolase [Mycolicibacterium canariasense]ORV04676.1 alpha/beta hydrolase [Mycolicibacterium canariasense]GAS96736.1 hydrolase [Mycolicibacterium canariasense]
MTMTAKRRRAHDRLAGLPGVRPVRRPIAPGQPGEFDLYYVRTGLKSAHPLLVIPGGPGMASVAPYRGLRRHAAAAGLDVIMVEHRGVGLSRHDDAGADLPPEAITVEQVIDDIAAVLDDAGVGSALVYGTSYGTYLAAGLGARHPHRVAQMVLDSPVLSAHDIEYMRAAIRGLLLHGADPETADLAPKVRKLLDERVLRDADGQVAGALYGYGGAGLLGRQIDLLLSGRTWVWSALKIVRRMTHHTAPFHSEDDLVNRIAFRELDFAGVPDGLPLDPSTSLGKANTDRLHFEGEPFDLTAEMPRFGWPTVVLSGGHDLVTPPALARRVAGLIPGAVLVELPNAGHSVLDTRERAALAVIADVRAGDASALPGRAAELDAMPANALVRLAISALAAATVAESAIPGRVRAS